MDFRECLPLWLMLTVLHVGAHDSWGQEEHVPFDVYPDLPVSALRSDVFVSDVFRVPDGRDLVEIPDGSGRFLIMRASNQLKLSHAGANQESHYLTIGPPNVAETEGSVSVQVHPDFAIEGAPGYGKLYTVGVDPAPEVDPDFLSSHENNYFHSVVTEWTADDIHADRFSGSGREVLRLSMGNRIHNINDLEFGLDGFLYLSVGDDRAVDQSADPHSPYGAVLRIDPFSADDVNAYGVPDDNPFVANGDGLAEVFAYGLRNPWRMTVDRESGAVYVNDIGHRSIEEVNLIEAANNYGWPEKEGSFLATGDIATPDLPNPKTGFTVAQQANLVDPLFEVDRTETNAIMGGVSYRGQRFPELQGKFVFGAWNFGDLFVGDPATGQIEVLMERGAVQAAMNGERFVSINADVDGELYLVGGSVVRGLFRYPDFDGSDSLDAADGDAICDHFGDGTSLYDLNGDLRIDQDDLDVFLTMAGALPGDLDLDGTVDFFDFLQMSRYFGHHDPDWSDGDLNCDNVIDFTDFLSLVDTYGKSLDTVSVPEPCGALHGGMLVTFVLLLRAVKDSLLQVILGSSTGRQNLSV